MQRKEFLDSPLQPFKSSFTIRTIKRWQKMSVNGYALDALHINMPPLNREYKNENLLVNGDSIPLLLVKFSKIPPPYALMS